MVIVAIGLVFVVGGISRSIRRRVPAGATRFRGTIVDVREVRSSLHRNRTLYGPVVQFDHPNTGHREELEPATFGRDAIRRGDTVELAVDPRSNRILVVSRQPIRDAIALPLIGTVLIALQIADWVA